MNPENSLKYQLLLDIPARLNLDLLQRVNGNRSSTALELLNQAFEPERSALIFTAAEKLSLIEEVNKLRCQAKENGSDLVAKSLSQLQRELNRASKKDKPSYHRY